MAEDRFKNNRQQQKTIAEHVERLALSRKLSVAQRKLIKLTPAWQQWEKQYLSENAQDQAKLSHFQNRKLTISCENSTVASQIRHLQKRIITHFNHQGFDDVKQLVVRIENPNHVEAHSEQIYEPASVNHYVSDNAVESVQQCQKNVSDESLSEALKRLEDTLAEKNSK